MAPAEEVEAWLRLGLVAELGPAAFRKLLADFGQPEAVVAASVAQLSHSVGREVAAAIKKGPEQTQLRDALDWLHRPGNALITLADAAYPRALLQTADPPPLLYVNGDCALLSRAALAVVGSRHATPQGSANAEAFSRELSQQGFCIVSGLALGIDAAAHRGGMQGRGSTIAVLGTGLDIVYPAGNRDLATDIARNGLLLSEFPLGTPARPSNFPRRNRLISGLALGVLVVEAALRSGSLITARYALEQGREVFAIPGSIHSPFSKGCHLLIKQGAKLVESTADILDELGIPHPAESMDTAGSVRHPDILDALGHDPADLDSICARSGLTAERASAMLLELELDGVVARLPGGKFQRVR